MNKLYVLIFCTLIVSCSKEKFLDAKPDQGLIIPLNLDELQAIIDNTFYLNGMQGFGSSGIVPILGAIGSDEYYIGRPNIYSSGGNFMKNTFTWNKEDVFAGQGMVYDWSQTYLGIFHTNIALEQLAKLSVRDQNSNQGKQIRGSALFHRAHLYYQLAQVFAPVYQKGSALQAYGLPLRLKGDVGEKFKRNTLEETYQQIIKDLKEALDYLPEISKYTTRPNLAAAHALFARIYLSMSDFPNALKHAEFALERHNALMNFNDLDSTATFSIEKDNVEVIFNCVLSSGGGNLMAFTPSLISVDTNIISAYREGDLRRPMFVKQRTQSQSVGMEFKGSYFGSLTLFAGIASDEIYLIKAECEARLEQTARACTTLNTLLSKRFLPEKFQPVSISDSELLVRFVLNERRKELVFRGLRWTDLRRLNLEPRFAITLKRFIDGETYELPPNDPRYTYPIPDDVLGFNPGMPPNNR